MSEAESAPGGPPAGVDAPEKETGVSGLRANMEAHKTTWLVGLGAATLIVTFAIFRQSAANKTSSQATAAPSSLTPSATNGGVTGPAAPSDATSYELSQVNSGLTNVTNLMGQFAAQMTALANRVAAFSPPTPAPDTTPTPPPPPIHVPVDPLPQHPGIPPAARTPRTIIVQPWPNPGSTLSSIAQLNGVSLGALEAANPQIANPNLIYPNQVVNLP